MSHARPARPRPSAGAALVFVGALIGVNLIVAGIVLLGLLPR